MDIFFNNAILHIVDNERGVATYSDIELDIDSDMVAEFLTKHIKKLMNNAAVKEAAFRPESKALAIFSSFKDKQADFKETSKALCSHLASIMMPNKNIPSAGVIITQFDIKHQPQLAIIKLNHKSFYTHNSTDNDNQIQRVTFGLPFDSGKVEEAVIVPFSPMVLKLIEKPYMVDLVETNYFSELFLDCEPGISKKEATAILNEAMEYICEQSDDIFLGAKLRVAIIEEALENDGELRMEGIAQILNEPLKGEFLNFVKESGIITDIFLGDKYCMRQFGTYKIKTASGIELKIPVGLVDDSQMLNLTDNKLSIQI